MSGKLNLPEQVKKEALIGTAFSWLSEQKDEVLELLLALREQPIPNEKLKESLALPTIDREMVQIIFFSGKSHCALTEVGEAVLKKIECVIQQYNRITNPSEIPRKEIQSKEKENDIRFRNRLEQLSEHHWETLLSYHAGNAIDPAEHSRTALSLLAENGMLSVSLVSPEPELPQNVRVYTITSFGEYCVRRYIQHVYDETSFPSISWSVLSESFVCSDLFACTEAGKKEALDPFSWFGIVKNYRKVYLSEGDIEEHYRLTALGKGCLALWKKDRQNDTGRNPETC